MANPRDYPPRKIRYSGANCGVQEVFECSTAVVPEREPERYAANDAMPGADDELVARILEAIGNTDEMQFIRKLMMEATPDGMGGAEMTGDDPHPMMMGRVDAMAGHGREPAMVEREKYNQLGKPGPLDAQEKYDRRDEAHGAVLESYDAHNESRRAISDRARAFSELNNCSYDEGLRGVGAAPARVHLPTASAV